MTTEQWDRDHRMNLRYFFINAQLAARSLIARAAPGGIVCISSVEGAQSAPNHASYGAAKAGLINLVRSMAVELAPHNIRVNSVAPGSIATPRIPASPERVKRTAEGLIPFKRLGTADEVAKAVLFLLSDMSSYVTGHTLLVDGGWMAASPLACPRFQREACSTPRLTCADAGSRMAFPDTLPHPLDDTDDLRAFLSSFTDNFVDKAAALRGGAIGLPLHRLAIHCDRQWPHVNHVAAD